MTKNCSYITNDIEGYLRDWDPDSCVSGETEEIGSNCWIRRRRGQENDLASQHSKRTFQLETDVSKLPDLKSLKWVLHRELKNCA